MADEKTTGGKATARAAGKTDDEPVLEPAKAAVEAQREVAREEKEAGEEVQTFPVERLAGTDGPALLGYEQHVIAGALAAVRKKNVTLEEAKAAVQAWLEAPVSQED